MTPDLTGLAETPDIFQLWIVYCHAASLSPSFLGKAEIPVVLGSAEYNCRPVAHSKLQEWRKMLANSLLRPDICDGGFSSLAWKRRTESRRKTGRRFPG